MTLHAHTMIYPAFAAAKQPVIDLTGHLIGGPDRKQDDARAKWLGWQKAIQQAERLGQVPPNVMDYFQKTKHLAHPPKSGDLDIFGKHEIDVPKEDVIKKPFRLTWSWTALSTFNRCPQQWAAKYFYKTLKEEETEALRYGNAVHVAMERAVLGTHTPNDSGLIEGLNAAKYIKALEAARAKGAEIHVEKELCFDRKLGFSSWKDWDNVWFRGKADVLIVNGDKLTVWDYKTGKVKPEPEQVKLMCAFAALYFPQAQTFDGKLLFLKHDRVEPCFEKPITRAELKPILKDTLAQVARMQQAVDCETFVAKKSGLCRNYCGVTTCPHCGG